MFNIFSQNDIFLCKISYHFRNLFLLMLSHFVPLRIYIFKLTIRVTGCEGENSKTMDKPKNIDSIAPYEKKQILGIQLTRLLAIFLFTNAQIFLYYSRISGAVK